MIQLRGHDAFDQPLGAAEVGKVVELRVHFEGGADRLASWVAEQVCGEKEESGKVSRPELQRMALP